jgi:hypothetical protein
MPKSIQHQAKNVLDPSKSLHARDWRSPSHGKWDMSSSYQAGATSARKKTRTFNKKETQKTVVSSRNLSVNPKNRTFTNLKRKTVDRHAPNFRPGSDTEPEHSSVRPKIVVSQYMAADESPERHYTSHIQETRLDLSPSSRKPRHNPPENSRPTNLGHTGILRASSKMHSPEDNQPAIRFSLDRSSGRHHFDGHSDSYLDGTAGLANNLRLSSSKSMRSDFHMKKSA